MKLKRLSVKNLAGLKDRELSFSEARAGAPSPLMLVTGAPQSGKTSLLRAIAAAKEAVGAYGAAPHPVKLVRPGHDAEIEATWSLSEAERRIAGGPGEEAVKWELSAGELPEVSPGLRSLFAKFSRSSERAKVELMPARRSLDTHLETPLLPKFPDEQEARARLRDTPGKYGGVLRALHDAAWEDARQTASIVNDRGVTFRGDLPDSIAPFKEAVAKMCPSVRLVAVEPRERTRPLVWFQTKDGTRVELVDLADSELQGFLFACAFTWLGLNCSIVLIDTPELHVHPAHQAGFFKALCELGSDNQIIAATTSPAILDSALPEQIIDLSKPMEKAA